MYLLELEAAGFQSAEVRLDLSFSSQTGLAIYLKPSNQQTLPSVSGTSISIHELSIAEEARKIYSEGKKRALQRAQSPRGACEFSESARGSAGILRSALPGGYGLPKPWENR